MRYLLNVVYALVLLVCLPRFAWQAWRTGKYRQGWRQKFFGHVAPRAVDRPGLWFHAVSVGEVNLLATLLQRWEVLHPDWQCVISTTTRSGYELARKRYAPRPVFYCPLDFSWAVSAAMRRIRPRALVLAELELWPNLISAARRHGARVVVVNGRLSERSFRGYRWLRPLIGKMLGRVEVIAAQDREYAERFLRLGARRESVVVTGSLKFDGAPVDRQSSGTRQLARLWHLQPDDVVWVAGSTQAPEEKFCLDVFRQLESQFPALKLIITPRHPERFDEVAGELNRSGVAWSRRTTLTGDATRQTRVLLVDTVGELGAWWGTADIAFVGGSLGSRGGQNMVEPAAYGAAVCFGPKTRNFRDIVRLLREHDAAVVVANADDLARFVRRCLHNTAYRRALGQRAQQLVVAQQGAADRTVGLLEACLHLPPATARRPAA